MGILHARPRFNASRYIPKPQGGHLVPIMPVSKSEGHGPFFSFKGVK